MKTSFPLRFGASLLAASQGPSEARELEIDSRIPRAVADARDQEYSWAEIGDLLGVTRASAWQRYVGGLDKKRSPLDPD